MINQIMSFSQKIESIQYIAGIGFTVTISGASQLSYTVNWTLKL